jgi:hypothetical protein
MHLLQLELVIRKPSLATLALATAVSRLPQRKPLPDISDKPSPKTNPNRISSDCAGAGLQDTTIRTTDS